MKSALELELIQLCATNLNWLNARSPKNGARSTKAFVPMLRTMCSWVQWGFILALGSYLACMALKLAGTLGAAYCVVLGVLIGVSLTAAVTLFGLNDRFGIN